MAVWQRELRIGAVTVETGGESRPNTGRMGFLCQLGIGEDAQQHALDPAPTSATSSITVLPPPPAPGLSATSARIRGSPPGRPATTAACTACASGVSSETKRPRMAHTVLASSRASVRCLRGPAIAIASGHYHGKPAFVAIGQREAAAKKGNIEDQLPDAGLSQGDQFRVGCSRRDQLRGGRWHKWQLDALDDARPMGQQRVQMACRFLAAGAKVGMRVVRRPRRRTRLWLHGHRNVGVQVEDGHDRHVRSDHGTDAGKQQAVRVIALGGQCCTVG